MNELQIFKNQQLIPVIENENGEVVISGRDLHKFLEVGTRYDTWIQRMVEYGFVENIDYISETEEVDAQNRARTYEKINHIMKLDMAKEIAMIQRNEKGKQARQYFIQVEKAWNSPEMIMKRALEYANKRVGNLRLENKEQQNQIETQRPKVIFADAVSASHTSILIGELAKILRQNGIDTGEKRLFEWLRQNGYLIRRNGTDYNMPTQRSMEAGWFEIKETSIAHSDGHITISKTTKLTGKGQIYFVNKFKEVN